MLAITGSMNIWYVANVKDMRMGRCRLLECDIRNALYS